MWERRPGRERLTLPVTDPTTHSEAGREISNRCWDPELCHPSYHSQQNQGVGTPQGHYHLGKADPGFMEEEAESRQAPALSLLSRGNTPG